MTTMRERRSDGGAKPLHRERVQALVRRVVREDRKALDTLAAYDGGESVDLGRVRQSRTTV